MHLNTAYESASPARHTDVGERRHVPALDGIRGLAILLVIAHHANLLPNTGWVGVDLFFVLSGYLITGILVAGREQRNYFKSFWGRRVLRIVPAYVAYLVVVTVLVPLRTKQPLDDVGWYWAYLTNVRLASGMDVPQLLTHLWSVAVEEQFYLVWPFVVWLLPVRRLRQLCIAGVVTALALRIVSVSVHHGTWERYALTPMRMDDLLLGAWLAVTAFPTSLAMRRIWGVAASVAAVLGFALIALCGRFSAAVETIGFTFFAVASGGLLWASIAVPSVASTLSARWLRAAGQLSYMAYLIHPLVRFWLERKGLAPGVTLAAVTVALTFAIAWVSWRVYEAPILRLKRYVPRQESPRAAREPAVPTPAAECSGS